MPNTKPDELTDVSATMTWDEFRSAGLLWFVNRQLHVFGVALVATVDEAGNATQVGPERADFRGFSPDHEALGFQRVTAFMAAELERLTKEVA